MKNPTEQLILNTARKHFVQNGYAATRMQQIADEAGINKAMLHYYFRSKEKLYQQIVSEILDFLIPRLSNAFDKEGSIFERIDHIVEAYIDTLIEHPDIPFFIMYELYQEKEHFIQELRTRAAFFPPIQRFMIQITQEMQKGNIIQINPIQLFMNVLGLTVFPFIVRPMFCTIFQFEDEQFEQLMEERKEIISDFLRRSLQIK